MLSVGVDTSTNSASAMASVKSSNKKYGTYVWNTANSENATFGRFFRIMNGTGNAYAASGQALGKGITDPYGLPYQCFDRCARGSWIFKYGCRRYGKAVTNTKEYGEVILGQGDITLKAKSITIKNSTTVPLGTKLRINNP